MHTYRVTPRSVYPLRTGRNSIGNSTEILKPLVPQVYTLFNGYSRRKLCLKSQKLILDTVSTTCDSGWVNR
jgi:hypothetical protein